MKVFWTRSLMAATLAAISSVSVAQQYGASPASYGAYRSVSAFQQEDVDSIRLDDPSSAPFTDPHAGALGSSALATPQPARGDFGPSSAVIGAPGMGGCDDFSAGYPGLGTSTPAGFRHRNREVCAVPEGAVDGGSYFHNPSVPCDTGCGGLSAIRVGAGRSANLVGGVGALIFRRDLEDDRGLSFNGAGQYLFSTDSDPGTMGGVETYLGRRGCNGRGWEARFWQLFPGQSSVALGGMPQSALGGLADVYLVPNSTDVLNIYNNADSHMVCRDNDFVNLEINMLRNGGALTNGGSFEFLGGFRWFQFDEELRYSAFSTYAGHPSQFDYQNSVQNTLLGGQLGGRFERCLGGRFRLATSFSAGLFNNRSRHNQRMYDPSGGTAVIYSGPFNGRPYDYTSSKNDIAMLGELNLGTYYMISSGTRLNVGYRVLGVSGVALAPDQIPVNFTDGNDLNRIDSNGSLILHGAYVGVQHCF